MNNIKKKSFICISLMLIVAMAFSTMTVVADEPNPVEVTAGEEIVDAVTPVVSDGKELPAPVFELIAETEKVALYADKKIGEIKFVDKVNNLEWFSNPQDKNATLDVGAVRERMFSQFTIDYSMAYNPLGTDSSSECLKYTRVASEPTLSAKAFNILAGYNENAGFTEIGLCDSLDHELVENGIKFIYKMPKFGFKIVIQYNVKDDYLETKVLTDESILKSIKMEKQIIGGIGDYATRVTEIDYNVTRINLLPMFGAGRVGEEGYMFVPDKSGVIVNYNNGKENYNSYSKTVYGRYYETKGFARRDNNGLYIPVFGNVKQDAGTLMGVITEGAAASLVTAFISGDTTDFNNVYPAMQNSTVEGSYGETEGIPYAESFFGDKDFTVRYYSLDAQKGGYVGMANKYKEYLVNEKNMKKTEVEGSSVFLDVYGQVNKDKNILGVPVEMPEALTTYDELVDIVGSLGESGIKPVVKYSNWQSADNDGKVVEKVKFSSYLGGKGGFKDMAKYMSENGINFYPGVDGINLSKGSLKYRKFASSAKIIDQSPITVTMSRVPIKLGSKWYLLKPNLVKESLGKYMNDYTKYDIGAVAIDSIASIVYSDFTKGSTVRAETVDVWEEVFKNAKETVGSVMVDKANAYAFPYADVILTTPSTDAYCQIANYTVPFYQMVLSGYVNYGTEPVNLSATPEMLRLKGIETGAALTYSIFASAASDVKGTYMNYLYSSSYDLIKDTIIQYYQQDKEYYSKVGGQEIINHEILADDVTRTTFENGVKVVVNYSDAPYVTEDGTVVEAANYKMQ